MPLYMCRWINGDISFIWAHSKTAAVEALDEIDNAERCPIIPIHDFMIHFGLTDQGELELQGFGEVIMGAPDGFNPEKPEGKALVMEAVERERKRVRPKPIPEPKTALGKEIKRQTGAPTSLIDEIVRRGGEKVLKKFRPRGKPH